MKFPALPSPFPRLRRGKSLYHPEHAGFANVWNWMADVWQHVTEYFVCGVNGAVGDVKIRAGEGINITTSGQTITVSIGDGEDITEPEEPTGGGSGGGGDSGGGGSGGGGSGGGGSGGGGSSGGGSGGGGSGGGGSGGDGGSNCNGFSDDVANPDDDPGGGNIGDDCNVLNGW